MTNKTIISMNVDITKLANEEAKRVIKELRQQLVDQEKLQDILDQHSEQANKIIDSHVSLTEELENLKSELSYYKKKDFEKVTIIEVSSLYEDLDNLKYYIHNTIREVNDFASLVFKFRDYKPKKKITKSKKKIVKSK